MTVPLQVVMCAVIAFPRAWDTVATAQVDARVAAIRAAGDPVTLAEVGERIPTPPPGKNAAELYNAAFKQMEALEELLDAIDDHVPIIGLAVLPDRYGPVPPAMLQAATLYLESARQVFVHLDKATDLEHCKHDLDLTRGIALELPHVGLARQAARLYALQAMVHTDHGRAERAADALVQAFRVGDALRHEPILVCVFTRHGCYHVALRQLERTLSRTVLSDPALRLLGDRLRAAADPNALVSAMVAERCFGMDFYRRWVLAAEDDELLRAMGVQDHITHLRRLFAGGGLKLDMVAYIDAMDAYVEALRKPYPQSLIEGARLADALAERLPRYPFIAKLFLDGIGNVSAAQQKHMARCDSARVALACLRYRAKTGDLPETLQALVPDFLDAVPPDPYTGKALLYHKDAAGFVVYARGQNQKDDRRDTEPRDDRDYPDVGFQVRWTKAKF
jgi:hypothetical protein